MMMSCFLTQTWTHFSLEILSSPFFVPCLAFCLSEAFLFDTHLYWLDVMVMAAHLLYFFTTRPHHYCYELSLSFFLGLFWERFLESCEQAELSKKKCGLVKKTRGSQLNCLLFTSCKCRVVYLSHNRLLVCWNDKKGAILSLCDMVRLIIVLLYFNVSMNIGYSCDLKGFFWCFFVKMIVKKTILNLYKPSLCIPRIV